MPSRSLQTKHRSADKARDLRALSRLHATRGRVYVLRHPRHLSAGQVFWSHHEKCVVVDQKVAFVGGMDLCEGRYDDPSHRLRDDGVTWPGLEYYQPNAPPKDDGDGESPLPPYTSAAATRDDEPPPPGAEVGSPEQNPFADPGEPPSPPREGEVALGAGRSASGDDDAVSETSQTSPLGSVPSSSADAKDGGASRGAVDRSKTPRLPWQDVALGVDGGAALDVSSHFTARWNHHRVQLRRTETPILLPHSDAPRRGVGPGAVTVDDEAGPPFLGRDTALAPAIQVARSVGRWSLGVEAKETSCHAAWCDTIANAEHFLYVEQQFWITSLDEDSERWEAGDDDGAPSTGPDPPVGGAPSTAAGPPPGGAAASSDDAAFRRSDGLFSRGPSPVVSVVVPPNVSQGESFVVPVGDPRTGVDKWVTVSVPVGCGPGSRIAVTLDASLGDDADGHKAPWQDPSRASSRHSGGLLARGIAAVGDVAKGVGVLYADATTAFTGGVRNRVGHALLERLRKAIRCGETFRCLVVLPLHPNGKFLESEEVHAIMQQQLYSVSRGPTSLLGKLRHEFPDVDLERYIKFACLRTWDDLDAGPASEMVYVHSKLLVADDAVAVVGSNNVNDRSLVGDRDTELCVVVEDPAAVKALRIKLWRMHLGMVPAAGSAGRDGAGARPRRPHHEKWDDDIDDPTQPRVWQSVLDTANFNTSLYEAAFDDAPWDEVGTLDHARDAIGLSRVSRHVTAPVNSDEWRAQVRAVHNTLSGVKGELVAFPERFLHAETLAPSLLSKIFVGRKLFQ